MTETISVKNANGRYISGPGHLVDVPNDFYEIFFIGKNYDPFLMSANKLLNYAWERKSILSFKTEEQEKTFKLFLDKSLQHMFEELKKNNLIILDNE